MVSSSGQALSSDDATEIDKKWKGGCLLSVHDSHLADAWINQHYDNNCLMRLRQNGINGSCASMLSSLSVALTIFGPNSVSVIVM